MKFIKILTICALLFLLMGMSSAVNLSDFQLNDDFNKSSPYYASNGNIVLSVTEDDIDQQDMFTTDNGVYRARTGEDNITNYIDTYLDDAGCLEIVEVNHTYIIIDIHSFNINKKEITECNKYMEEFNELNNLTPKNPFSIFIKETRY